MDRVYRLKCYPEDARVVYEEVDLVNKRARRVVMESEAAKEFARKLGELIGLGALIIMTLGGIATLLCMLGTSSRSSSSSEEVAKETVKVSR